MVVAEIRLQVISSARGAGVMQIFTAYKVQIVTDDQPAIWREAIFGPSHIESREARETAARYKTIN